VVGFPYRHLKNCPCLTVREAGVNTPELETEGTRGLTIYSIFQTGARSFQWACQVIQTAGWSQFIAPLYLILDNGTPSISMVIFHL